MSDWLLVAGGVGVFNALFLGIVLLMVGNSTRNRLLAVLFVSIAVRTGKSVAILVFGDIPDSAVGVGLVGMALAGPLLFLYIRTTTERTSALVGRDYWHFSLSGVVALLLFLNSDRVVYWLYVTAALQMFIYLSMSLLLLRRTLRTIETSPGRWLTLLLTALAIHWALYTSQLFIETPSAYFAVSITSALVMYALLYGVLKWHRALSAHRPGLPDNDKLQVISLKLRQLMEDEQLFKLQDLSVGVLARHLQVKPYVVSNVLKALFDKSFPEFVNEYRIREAERMLRSPQHDMFSIEAIAFDCGFNTPSAFYASFKKYAACTPREFRRRRAAESTQPLDVTAQR